MSVSYLCLSCLTLVNSNSDSCKCTRARVAPPAKTRKKPTRQFDFQVVILERESEESCAQLNWYDFDDVTIVNDYLATLADYPDSSIEVRQYCNRSGDYLESYPVGADLQYKKETSKSKDLETLLIAAGLGDGESNYK